jgi:hypothetical protein
MLSCVYQLWYVLGDHDSHPGRVISENCTPCTRMLWTAELPHLDQLQCLAARALDHHGARVAELVGLFEEPDAPAP